MGETRRRLGAALLGAAGILALSTAALAQSLTQALDAPGLVWIATNSTGGATWTATSAVTHDGVDAARTGTPPLNELSYLQTTLTNSGTLTFWARPEVTGGSYFQSTLLGGATYRFLDPEWRAYSYEVPRGTNTLFFVFWNRDSTGVAGDGGWVDEVRFADYTGRAPEFIEPPSNVTAGEGYVATLRSVVVGQKPFTAYWISASATNASAGGQSSELWRVFNPVRAADAGTWRLVVSNQFGGITSPDFTLTVTSTPPHTLFLTESLGTGLNPLPLATNAPIELSISARGTPPFFYQWKHAGTNLPGAISGNLDLSPFRPAKAGEYTCVVSNSIGRAEAGPITLEFRSDRPVILTQPLPLTLAAGEELGLWAEVEGGRPFAYQWFKDDVALAGADQSALYRSPAALADTGYYQLQISNGNGMTRSDRVRVTVGDAVPTGDALEASALPWSSENDCSPGTAGWYGQTSVTHDGVDALASEPMAFDNVCQRTLLTKISGSGTVSFWWKLEGAAADELRAEVLDIASNVLATVTRSGSEGPDWAATNLTVTTGAAFVRWTLASGDGNDGLLPLGWLDEVQAGSSDSALDYALNDPGLLWLTGSQDPISGNSNDGWVAQTTVSSDGIAAAQSPRLQAQGSSWLQTTITGPAVLEVKAMVRGDPDALLEFTLDGVPAPFGSVGGETNNPPFYTMFFILPPGDHTARWELKAGAQASANATAWLDRISVTPGQTDIGQALDAPQYAWLGYLWTVDPHLQFSNGTAAKSPHNTAAPLDTTMIGPAEIKFDWRVRADSGGSVRFEIDDVLEAELPADGRQTETVTARFGPGIHFLRWIYQKDAFSAATVWIDNVSVTPNRRPVASNDLVTRFTDQVIMSVSQLLLRNDRDPDPNSVIRLESYSQTSTNGGTVTLQGDWLTYTPRPGANDPDEFAYTITDEWGGLASAKVVIQPESPREIPPVGRVIILHQPGTIPAVRFGGIPGRTYALEASPSGFPSTWTVFDVKTAGPDGSLDALEPSAVGQPQRFYRTVQQ